MWLNNQMDTAAIRRQNLIRLIESHPYNGNQAAFARAAGIKTPQINRWISPTAKDTRAIREDSARNIEKALGLDTGALDKTTDQQAHIKATTPCNISEAKLSPHAAKLVRLIRQVDKSGRLSPALAQTVEQVIRVAITPANTDDLPQQTDASHSTPGILADDDPDLIAAIGRVRQHDLSQHSNHLLRKKSPSKA